MFGSLDFVYVPTADVDRSIRSHVDGLGATLMWRVRAMGTTVACLRLDGGGGPQVLLAGHLSGPGPILVYRVGSYQASVAALASAGVELTELEIPHGPCASFTFEGGQRYAVYELARPGAASAFDGRIDP